MCFILLEAIAMPYNSKQSFISTNFGLTADELKANTVGWAMPTIPHIYVI